MRSGDQRPNDPLPARRGGGGQSLAEFALVLPMLMLILLIAVDFGRLLAGWVTVTNAARVAANYAGADPTAPFGPGSEYETVVRNESNNGQCTFPAVPAPVFDPDTNVGSSATVTITCDFRMITPFISSFVGNPVRLSVSTVFAIRGGTIAGIPTVPPGPCTAPNLTVPPLVGLTVAEARGEWTTAGFTGAFTPASGHNGQTVTGQIPDIGACRAPTQSVVVEY